jgi:hypothetical protein
VVECPHCIGECETCRCELIDLCLGGAGVFPDLPSILRRSDST